MNTQDVITYIEELTKAVAAAAPDQHFIMIFPNALREMRTRTFVDVLEHYNVEPAVTYNGFDGKITTNGVCISIGTRLPPEQMPKPVGGQLEYLKSLPE